jgi:hypothetical protein
MINSLDIGKYIYNILSTDSSLMEECTKIYPLIADNDAKFPFVTYRRVGLVSHTCKDGCYEDEVSVEIKVVSDKYSVGLSIANKIRSLIQVPYRQFTDFEVNDVIVDFAIEEFIENAFVQTIQFTLKIND